MFDWFKDAYNDLIQWFKDIFNAVVDFFTELPIKILDGLLSAISSAINSIPVPDFLQNGLSTLINGIDPSVLYFLDQSNFPECLAILGAGLSFRLSRKLFTLGQW
ncbi:MAG: DUF2523 domain-containing protein [Cycloclasticus sp.]|nr:DUF2523 domain-containing protein [Cycloclasticus sp.]